MKFCKLHLFLAWISITYINTSVYAEVIVKEVHQYENKQVSIKLNNDDVYIGQLSCKESTCVIVTSDNRVKFPRSKLVSVEDDESEIEKIRLGFDRNRTRYLMSSSALSLKSSEIYFSQRHLIYSTLQFGITDNLMAGVGTIIPTILEQEVYLMPSLKYGESIDQNWHWSIGLEGLIMPSEQYLYETTKYDSYSTLFLGTTYTSKDFQVGFNTGTAVGYEYDLLLRSKYFLFSLAATYHVSKYLDLVTDHVILYMNAREPSSASYHGYALRIHGSHFSVDLGLVSFTHSNIELPWLDLTWNL